ncbi:hypothetical protein [Silicimonas sp. MF1-12-2]|uniref:hypothetical protein n=1 Tax=Silicimonas sp. MF1-12-2 TaxID=3384793 RepID=UPI0039B6518D
MNALVGGLWASASRSRDSLQLRVNVTNSGFNVAAMPTSRYDRAFLLEFLFKLTGVLFIPAGGIFLFLPMMFLPSTTNGTALWTSQVALLAAFIFVGVALHRWANKGFRQRIQVDAARSEIRIGTVNIEGDFHLRATYAVSDIESFFIIRSGDAALPAKLKMRLKTGTQTISVVEGPEKSLVPILERITLTLRPPKMKNRRVRTQTTGRFIRMSFN